MEYYVYQNIEAAQSALSIIGQWTPIVGLNNGQPAPENQQTELLISQPVLMLSGEYAIPSLSENRLRGAGELSQDENGVWNYAGVAQTQIDEFLNHGQDLRTLTSVDFPAISEP